MSEAPVPPDNTLAPARSPADGTASDRLVDVVCGVIWSADGRYLLAQRPKGRIWDGYWEFPGGKIEAGETPAEAMDRELAEELGIRVTRSDPWLLKVFDYPHARVRLHFFHVREWSGTPTCLEGQQLHWQTPGEPCGVGPLLPANEPILRALDLPSLFPVTPDISVPHVRALALVNARLSRLPWSPGPRVLQVRRGEVTRSEWRDWSVLCAGHGVTAVLNATPDLAATLGASAVHLSAARLAALHERPPHLTLLGASVHCREEIERAAGLGLDYVILGSVKETASHPGHAAMGWITWADTARWASVPSYAIGGLRLGDLDDARRLGATGIAMIGGAWNA